LSLNIGIVGLPNVGKSTVFNALTGAQNAVVANYPFCTIQPNRAIVPLPDDRLKQLAKLVNAPQTIYATITFVDIAGLVKGAHQGEGLGNQFLGHIRDAAALLHVVRCFEDPNVVHVSAQPSPGQDIEVINVELALADMAQLERKIERLQSAVKGDRKLVALLELSEDLHAHLAQGQPASTFSEKDDERFEQLNDELRLLTAKPLIYVANVDEDTPSKGNSYLDETRGVAASQDKEVVELCAELEADLLDMPPQERDEYLALSGFQSSGLKQVIQKSFSLLDLISFFTFNEKEARAWNVLRGSTAPKAAGAIHTDFERGFIRAEVIPFEVFEKYGSSTAVKAAGLMRLEGKDYQVQDGDVIYFRFNI
jgi:GTP-binding protein YchF